MAKRVCLGLCFSYRSEEAYATMLDEMGDYPLEFRIALLVYRVH